MVQPLAEGWVIAGDVVWGDGVGLLLGLIVEVKKLKSHCKSMEGLVVKVWERQAVPTCHLEAERKVSQPLLMCLSAPCPAGFARVAEST